MDAADEEAPAGAAGEEVPADAAGEEVREAPVDADEEAWEALVVGGEGAEEVRKVLVAGRTHVAGRVLAVGRSHVIGRVPVGAADEEGTCWNRGCRTEMVGRVLEEVEEVQVDAYGYRRHQGVHSPHPSNI